MTTIRTLNEQQIIVVQEIEESKYESNLARHMQDRWYFSLLEPLLSLMMQPAAMGALPTVRAAVDPTAAGAGYYGPDGFMEQRGYPVVVQSNDASHNVTMARRLWEISEQLTGVHYNWSVEMKEDG